MLKNGIEVFSHIDKGVHLEKNLKVGKWNLPKTEEIEKQIFVAGGLSHTNIKELILKYKPWGVDVSSGIESEKGKKSETLMKKFVENVRMADSEKNEKK